MSDKNLPLYGKYRLERHDPSGKHKNCFYFVLDLDHDKFALPALDAYAKVCKSEYPELARDLEAAVRLYRLKIQQQPVVQP